MTSSHADEALGRTIFFNHFINTIRQQSELHGPESLPEFDQGCHSWSFDIERYVIPFHDVVGLAMLALHSPAVAVALTNTAAEIHKSAGQSTAASEPDFKDFFMKELRTYDQSYGLRTPVSREGQADGVFHTYHSITWPTVRDGLHSEGHWIWITPPHVRGLLRASGESGNACWSTESAQGCACMRIAKAHLEAGRTDQRLVKMATEAEATRLEGVEGLEAAVDAALTSRSRMHQSSVVAAEARTTINNHDSTGPVVEVGRLGQEVSESTVSDDNDCTLDKPAPAQAATSSSSPRDSSLDSTGSLYGVIEITRAELWPPTAAACGATTRRTTRYNKMRKLKLAQLEKYVHMLVLRANVLRSMHNDKKFERLDTPPPLPDHISHKLGFAGSRLVDLRPRARSSSHDTSATTRSCVAMFFQAAHHFYTLNLALATRMSEEDILNSISVAALVVTTQADETTLSGTPVADFPCLLVLASHGRLVVHSRADMSEELSSAISRADSPSSQQTRDTDREWQRQVEELQRQLEDKDRIAQEKDRQLQQLRAKNRHTNRLQRQLRAKNRQLQEANSKIEDARALVAREREIADMLLRRHTSRDP